MNSFCINACFTISRYYKAEHFFSGFTRKCFKSNYFFKMHISKFPVIWKNSHFNALNLKKVYISTLPVSTKSQISEDKIQIVKLQRIKSKTPKDVICNLQTKVSRAYHVLLSYSFLTTLVQSSHPSEWVHCYRERARERWHWEQPYFATYESQSKP